MKSERRLLKAGLVFSAVVHVILIAWWLRPEAASVRSSPASRSRITQVHLVPAPATALASMTPQAHHPADDSRERSQVIPPVKQVAASREAQTVPEQTLRSELSGHDVQIVSEAGTASGNEATAFQKALSEHIGQYRHYPQRARQGRLTGVVEVGFTMDRSGTVLNVWIRQESGFAILDGEALATVWRAQPLPRIPANLPDRLSIFLPISFFLS